MRKGDLKRARILDVAEKLFFEKGYDRTSVQDILDELQISKGGFYHYFDAKDSVLRAVFERRIQAKFEVLAMELHDGRRGTIDRLNLLLSMANLFEGEDPSFAALMSKLCYRDGDASLCAFRRRVLIERLLPWVNDVIGEGIADGTFHSSHPVQIGRLLILLAFDVDDEVCGMLAKQAGSPDVMLQLLELLNAWRDGAEILVGAPYGSIALFDAGRLVSAWQIATAILTEQEAETL